MSSLIPKISIGRDTNKGSRFDLSSLTHTTSEIGYVQPTFSKFIVPGSKVRIGTRTGVRLSPLFVPTMGEIDVRHYHNFIPFNTLWFPFDAFITHTNYTLPDGSTYQPTSIPYFTVKDIFRFLFSETAYFGYGTKLAALRDSLSCSFCYYDEDDFSYKAVPGGLLLGMSTDYLIGSVLALYPKVIFQPYEGEIRQLTFQSGQIVMPSPEWSLEPVELTVPSAVANDFCYVSNQQLTIDGKSRTLIVCFNFNGALKRLRTAFLGLGYSFNPFDTTPFTPLALLAFYKSYWEHFGVNRTFNFFNTNCYKLIKYLSDHIVTQLAEGDFVSDMWLLFADFIGDLSAMTYTCPPDYFNSADRITQRGAQSVGTNIPSGTNGIKSDFATGGAGMYDDNYTYAQLTYSRPMAGNAADPLSQKLAMRLLRFVNKNSVIGRSIEQILRVRYGYSDVHNTTHEDVIRVGASSCPIEISAVYNNTDSGDMPLGSYAGLGVGSRRSKMFTFKADSFGIIITMTAVVPKMGYWQGSLKENTDGINGSFDFYTPEYDAIGWQAVKYNELIADRQHQFISSEASILGHSGVWGYQPFYSHLKVGHNRCLADISIPHMRESMLPYTLDRYFPDVIQKTEDGTNLLRADYGPVNSPQTFRSGTQGHTNRIFSDTSRTDDHVIMQIFFDVKMTAPMKSMATSYDTWDEESKTSVEVNHE